MTPIARLSLIGLSIALSACSVLESDKIDYKSATKAPTLEVPPDLTQLSKDNRYAVAGGGAVSAAGFQTAQAKPVTSNALPNTLGDVRIERSGNQRWLVVKRSPEVIWSDVKDFWQENGFVLTTEQAALGVMETDWAENRAKIPQDFLRNTIGKLIDGLYSSGERDRFRTRLERNADGSTEIFISHRGLEEVYTNATTKDRTVWQPRATDHGLEAEFLRRLMAKLGGATVEQARAQAEGQAPARESARVVTVNNVPAAQLDDGFDRAWRRVGLTLDRTGFTVEDRDRSKGIYFVRYVPPNPDKKEPGFFAKMLGNTDTALPPVKYQISVRSEGNSTTVSVLSATGSPETSENAQRIVKVLVDDLK